MDGSISRKIDITYGPTTYNDACINFRVMWVIQHSMYAIYISFFELDHPIREEYPNPLNSTSEKLILILKLHKQNLDTQTPFKKFKAFIERKKKHLIYKEIEPKCGPHDSLFFSFLIYFVLRSCFPTSPVF